MYYICIAVFNGNHKIMTKPTAARINIVIIVLSASLSIFGCSNNSTTSAPPTTLTVPKAGSMFVVHAYNIDSSSRMIDSTQYYDTLSVIATGISYKGKTNVMQLRTPTSGRDIYQNFESNGDISRYDPGSVSPGALSGWVTYPVGSKGKTMFNTYDTTILGHEYVQTLTLTYMSDGDRSLVGHNFYVVGVREDLAGYGTPDGTVSGPETLWFAPEIGQYVGSDMPPYRLTNGLWNNGYHAELNFYQLK
jgi:hypothetical protein